MTSLQAKVDAIKAALTSPATCSPSTVTILSSLLAQEPSNPPQNTSTLNAALVASKSAVNRNKLSAKSGSKSAVGVQSKTSTTAATNSQLSPRERLVLATETINITLKTLDNVIKAPPPVRRQASAKDVLKGAARQPLRRSISLPQSPIPRSLERTSTSLSNRSSRSSSIASVTSPGLKTVAECARLGFSCLRTLQTSKQVETDLTPFRAEQGMLVLIGKLITLGLDDLALKEVRILKRRIDGQCLTQMTEVKRPMKKPAARDAAQPAPATLVGLLCFEELPINETVLNLALGVQIQALKLLAASRKPALVEAAISKLQVEYKRSPVQLLLSIAKNFPKQADKVTKQLDLLFSLIHSLCPSVSTSDDPLALVSKLSISPSAALQLQSLAYRTRTIWWKICGHKPDLAKELLSPMSRCLIAFARRSQEDSTSTYKQADAAFRPFKNLAMTGLSEKHLWSSVATILKTLGALAQNASYYDDALDWIEHLRDLHAGGDASESDRCSVAVKLAALKLITSPYNLDLGPILKDAVDSLQGPLKGNSQELDDLLLDISMARKSAVALLSKRNGAAARKDCHGLSDDTRDSCETLITLCVRFAIRYLGSSPESKATPKVVIAYEQRRRIVTTRAVPIIDSALFLVRSLRSEGRLSWDYLDSTLQDCKVLCDATLDVPETADGSNISSPYAVKFSQLYYTQHLDCLKEGPDAAGSKATYRIRALQRAIDCLRPHSHGEKELASLITMLERLSGIFNSALRYEEGQLVELDLRDVLVKSGALGIVAEAAERMSLNAAWEQSDHTLKLARTLAVLVKLETKARKPFARYFLSFDSELSPEESGIVLEKVLDVLSLQSTGIKSLQDTSAERLLATYDARTFPVRRLRVLANLLRLESAQPVGIKDDAKNIIALASIEAVVDASKDRGLRAFVAHLKAMASSILELQEEHPRLDLIRQHLAVWCAIIEECKDYDSLCRKVDDVPKLISHLHSIADFLDLKGFGTARVAVLRMISTLNEYTTAGSSPSDLLLSQIRLGQQLLQLGYSGKAGLALAKAHTQLSHNGIASHAIIKYHLAYADYMVSIGSIEKCEESLQRAQVVATQESTVENGLFHSSDKVSLMQLLADASYVQSLLASEKGAMRNALTHARRSLRLMYQAWNILERKVKKQSAPAGNETRDLEASSFNMSISLPANDLESPTPPAFWPLIHPLFRSLSRVSELYAHHGLYQETLFYAGQAQLIVEKLGSCSYTASAIGMLGNTLLRAGMSDDAAEHLNRAKELGSSWAKSITAMQIDCYLASMEGQRGNHEGQLAHYNDAEAVLTYLSDSEFINDLDSVVDRATELEIELSKLSIKPRKTKAPSKAVASSKSRAKKVVAQANTTMDNTTTSIPEECLGIRSLNGLVLRQKAQAMIQWKSFDEASDVLKAASSLSITQSDTIENNLGLAKGLLYHGIEQMAADPTFSVLQDSTISFPSVVGAAKLTAAIERNSLTKLTPSRKNFGDSRLKSPSDTNFVEKFRQAQEHLKEAYAMSTRISSSSVMHNIASLLNTTTLILSAMGNAKGKVSMHAGHAICSAEMARTIAMKREMEASSGDSNSVNREDVQWPMLSTTDAKKCSQSSAVDVVRFQKDYIDIIPASWTAISISLSENGNGLCLTKFQAGQNPFVLRLPLDRGNSRDMDEQVFGFAEGSAEMLEIIELANESAHGAKDITTHEGKKAWFEERDELDARLKDLLENIERVWLGGFKGIFSQQPRKADLLARFQRSFQLILDKYLPTRQKTGKRGKTTKVTLDARILELFVGLGDPEAESADSDPDEPLNDLIYFVIDVLQFHGEQNAYDEIDWDSILIETRDALHCYHEAILETEPVEEDRHTILILDKSLHSFPWESLPCMEGLALSRLPSLGCLRDRIIAQQKAGNCADGEAETAGHYIEKESGTYILNPGNDLSKTQTAFSPSLSALPAWSSITARIPTEEEFQSHLSEKDLLLYFGHGSGVQYIRPKVIKRLEKCAVAVLMGCSSGTITEVGEFENYGTIKDYLMGGAPAVVGTLWDVTDGDIDRFAMRMLREWGLFEAPQDAEQDKMRGKKGKAHARNKVRPGEIEVERKEGDSVSLVAAVGRGRKACHYRYLTAAAVCVYGIPVYFK